MLNRLSLNKLSLSRVDLNRIGGRDVGVSGRPYIDPELLSHVKMAISTWGKTNDDPDRAVLKDLSGNGNDMRLLNFGFAGNSGYGLYKTNFLDYNIDASSVIKTYNKVEVTGINYRLDWWIAQIKSSSVPSYKVKISGTTKVNPLRYRYYDNSGSERFLILPEDGVYTLPADNAPEGGDFLYGFLLTYRYDEDVLKAAIGLTIEIIPDFEGWLCTDGVDDIIVSVKPVSEMLEGSNEFTVISIIHYINVNSGISTVSNNFIGDLGGKGVYAHNSFSASETNKTGIYGYTYNIPDRRKTVIGILGDEKDYAITDGINVNCIDEFTVNGFRYSDLSIKEVTQIAYAGGFIANKVLTTDEINQIIAYYNLDRPGQIIKPQLYCNIKKQGITNENHAEFNDQLIDFVGGHNIQLNNIGWEGESGIIDGALYLDGINDFGEVTGLPVVKDYTVVADRARLNNGGPLLSKSADANKDAGAFILELGSSQTYSYYASTSDLLINNNRCMSYQSKYIYNGRNIYVGKGIDSSLMWLGTVRDGDNRFSKLALWSLMLFPYSLSEFLLERQLRKYKAGTLYPDMIEFRPIVKSNIPYSSISYSVNPGVYVTEGSTVTITITLSNASDKLIGVSSNAISDMSVSGGDGTYEITGKVTKSPQKISIVISSYLTMLGNETLISNETLIKNE
ncbi:hypothetical protein DXB21_18120 [Bacteroides faecis]|uniref:hypothetical protein n=1 Tax=Bacteroides faecis TaxID=674529 RepID=UPI000E44466D|nr:hypothetical protein [Bacteroides faecis]RGO29843.1 hypothetical protein DXB21_18120 [Bacteroides faecis]